MSEQTSTAEQINDLRQRYLKGIPWSRDELQLAINTMIGDRLRSVQDAEAPKKAKAKPISLDHMLPGAVKESPKEEVKALPAPKAKPPVTGFF